MNKNDKNETEAHAAFPNKLQAFGVVVVVIVLEMILVLIMRDFSLDAALDRLGAAAFITVAANGIVFVFLTTYKKLSYASLFHSASNSVVGTLATVSIPILFIVPGLALLVGAIDLIVTWMIPMSAAELKMFEDMMEVGATQIFFVCIGGPILEEMLFRGIILRSFLNQYTRTTSILWSAALFGLAHLNIYQFFTALILGIVLGWLYERTRSLWPSILLHGSFNAYSVWLSNADSSTTESPDMLTLGMQLGIAIIGGCLLLRILQPSNIIPQPPDREPQ